MTEYEIAVLTIYVKGALAVLLGAGGIYALNRGAHLISHGAGANQDDNFIELYGFKAGSKTVGSLVMITSCVWGLLAYQTRPAFQGQQVRVAQLDMSEDLKTRLITSLAQDLTTQDPAVRAASARVLAQLRDRRALAALIAAIDTKDPAVLEALATSLEATPPTVAYDVRSMPAPRSKPEGG